MKKSKRTFKERICHGDEICEEVLSFGFRAKRLLKNRYFYIGLIILFLGFYLTLLVSEYINNNYPNLPVLKDVVLDKLPFFNIGFLYDLFNILAMTTFILYAYFKDYKRIPYFLTLLGAIMIVRAIFMGLTPFEVPYLNLPNNAFLNKIESLRMGVYPSGHVGSSFLAFLLIKGSLKYILLFLCLGQIASLLLSRGHYSVDIFSAIIFAYALYCFGEKHLKGRFTLK